MTVGLNVYSLDFDSIHFLGLKFEFRRNRLVGNGGVTPLVKTIP